MPFQVRPTPLAAEQIRRESRWWRKNRPFAPSLFRDEMARAFELISEHPEVGAEADDAEIAEVRRVLLAATQHYLYYSVNEAERTVLVLALWSTRRGEGPGL